MVEEVQSGGWKAVGYKGNMMAQWYDRKEYLCNKLSQEQRSIDISRRRRVLMVGRNGESLRG